MSWDYELAGRIKGQKRESLSTCLEGKVVSTAPLTISLYGGEVMAPPAPLTIVASANGHWEIGDKVVCAWMGKTLVILGRL